MSEHGRFPTIRAELPAMAGANRLARIGSDRVRASRATDLSRANFSGVVSRALAARDCAIGAPVFAGKSGEHFQLAALWRTDDYQPVATCHFGYSHGACPASHRRQQSKRRRSDLVAKINFRQSKVGYGRN